MFGERQPDPAEASGDQVHPTGAQLGSRQGVGRELHDVEVAPPPVRAAQSQLGVPAGAPKHRRDGGHGVRGGCARVDAGDVQKPAAHPRKLLRDHGRDAGQGGVLGLQRLVADHLVHAPAEHVDRDGHARADLVDGLRQGQDAVKSRAARPAQLLVVEARCRIDAEACQVHDRDLGRLALEEGAQERAELRPVGQVDVRRPGLRRCRVPARTRDDDCLTAIGELLCEGVTEDLAVTQQEPQRRAGLGPLGGPVGRQPPPGGRGELDDLVGRRRCAARAERLGTRLHPVPLALERVRRQADDAGAGAGGQHAGIDGDARAPQATYGASDLHRVVGGLAYMTQRGDGGASGVPARVRPDKTGQGVSGPDLEEHHGRLGQERLGRLGKPDRPA